MESTNKTEIILSTVKYVIVHIYMAKNTQTY